MENIDNWHMLSNTFVAEETEEILTPEIMTEYVTISKQHEMKTIIKQEPGDDAIPYIQHIQEEAIETSNVSLQAENEEISIKQEQIEQIPLETTKTQKQGNDIYNADDDAIFDFEMDTTPANSENIQLLNAIASETMPALTSTGRPVRAAVLSKAGQLHKQALDEQPLDYECAILYICPACGQEYFSHESWKRHLHVKHEFNTRTGLNFERVDKLYHRCIQCSKHIAMHSMENLLKHKFTHLPYRCTKCRICLRQYKYRQDLLVHLRMTHNKELLAILQSGKWELENKSILAKERHENDINNKDMFTSQLAIKEIKANAVDIYSDSSRQQNYDDIENMDDDEVCVQNERLVLEEEDNDDKMLQFDQSNVSQKSLLETALNRNDIEKDGVPIEDLSLCAPYIMHVCPQCGDTFEAQFGWQRHIEMKHSFGTAEGLGFTLISNNEKAMCSDCAKVVYNVVDEMQTHRFTHTRHRNWLRCSLCYRSFTMRKDLVRHLLLQHNIAGIDADENDGDDDRLQQNSDPYTAERDIYEPHIDYLCPQCGRSYKDKKIWRRHLIFAHRLADLKVLNFRVINESQVRCLECDKIITNAYGIHNAQQHRFTHMPHKAFIRCRICSKSYTDRKGCVKHIRTKHQTFLQTLGQPFNISNKIQNNSNIQTQINRDNMQEESVNHYAQRKKEIVRTAKYLFEIEYLDDEQEVSPLSDNDIEDDNEETDKILERSLLINNTFKCKDCAARFSNSNALQAHISEAHQPITKKSRHSSPHRPMEHTLDQIADDEFYQQFICYLCPACGIQFTEQSNWRQHLNEVHSYDHRHSLNFKPISPYSYSCLQCGHIADSKLRAMQEHMFKHLRYQQYIVCRLCKGGFSLKKTIIQHLQMQHQICAQHQQQQKQQQQPQQQQKEIDKTLDEDTRNIKQAQLATKLNANFMVSTEYTHNAVDHETITYFCPSCNENFDTHYMWRRHIVSVHNLNNCAGLNFRQIDRHHYICLQCYKRVTVTHTKGAICQLQSHKFRHLPYRSFKCTACEELFVRKQMFFKHLNRVTNLCSIAPSSTAKIIKIPSKLQKSANSSARQLLTRSPSSPKLKHLYFETNDFRDCNSSTSIINLESSTDKMCGFIFICPACGLDFYDQQLWREHINNVHDLGRRSALKFKRLNATLHECLQCEEQVHGKKLRDLQTHQFKHMPFTSYLRCTLCKAAYTHLRNMKDHMRNKHPEINIDKQTGESLAIIDSNADSECFYDESISIKSGEDDRDKCCGTIAENEDNVHNENVECDDIDSSL